MAVKGRLCGGCKARDRCETLCDDAKAVVPGAIVIANNKMRRRTGDHIVEGWAVVTRRRECTILIREIAERSAGDSGSTGDRLGYGFAMMSDDDPADNVTTHSDGPKKHYNYDMGYPDFGNAGARPYRGVLRWIDRQRG